MHACFWLQSEEQLPWKAVKNLTKSVQTWEVLEHHVGKETLLRKTAGNLQTQTPAAMPI